MNFAAMALLGLAGACSLVQGSSDLIGPLADAGNSADVAAMDSAPNTPDAFAPSDSATSFCATQAGAKPLFCEDFDTHPIDVGWDGVVGSGSAVLDTSSVLSAPFAAKISTANSDQTRYFQKSFPNSTGDLRIHFGFRITMYSTANTNGVDFMVVKVGAAQIEMEAKGLNISLHDRINGTYRNFHGPAPKLELGAWRTYDVHVHIAATGGGTASVDMEGAQAVAPFALDAAFTRTPTAAIQVGCALQDGSTKGDGWEGSIDNVAVFSE